MSKPVIKKDIEKKKKSKKEKGFFRENIESILIAIALAFRVRVFVVEGVKRARGGRARTLGGVEKEGGGPNYN